MQTRALPFALALLLVSVGPVQAQPPARGPGGPMMMGARNPVTFLLEKHEELGLTDEQMTSMKVLADSLELLNEPELAKMEAARASGDRRGAMQELRPVMMALRERNEAFLERTRALLTDEQKPVAEKLLEEIMPRRRPGGPGGGGGF